MKGRLQKLLAACGMSSRREAEEWIAAGRVTVNGRTAHLGESADLDVDTVLCDGRPLSKLPTLLYVLLYKPSGYVTTRHDPLGRPNVIDLLKKISIRLNPVGRLDLTTEGLLLLTNDGELAHGLTHPRHNIDKTYLVRVRGQLGLEAKNRLEQGVMLEDGMTAPARIENIRFSGSHCWFEITIHEGRNRQVRRMCEAVGYPVSRLKRVSLAFLTLGDLKPGEFRYLSDTEVLRLRELVDAGVAR